MELRELRSFSAAAKLKSISKAAEQLDVGQPTVSTHIKKLESELGMMLFDRVRRPIQLTLAGARLAEVVGPLVEGIDGLAATAAMAEETGPVAVASLQDIIPHTLLRVVSAFMARHPHVHVRIRSGHMSEVLDLVANGEVDMGIAPGPGRGPEFDFQGLFAYKRVLITPLGHPLLDEPLDSLDQIAKWPLILMGRLTYTRAMLEAEFRRHGLDYEIVVELDSMDMIKRYVALGMGVSVGPHLAIEPEDHEQLGVVSLDNLLPIEQAGVITLRGKTLSGPAEKFIAVMKDTLAPASASH
jgi:DNA-binding transcriptional LysR family regulator